MRTIRFTVLSTLVLLAIAMPAAADCSTCTIVHTSWNPGFSVGGGDGGIPITSADCTPTYQSGRVGIQDCRVISIDDYTQTCTGSDRVNSCYEYPPVCSPWDLSCGGILASTPAPRSLGHPILIGL